MTEEEFISGLVELGLDSDQVQAAKSQVPTAHQIRMIRGEDTAEYSDEQIEEDISAARKAIFDEYKKSGEQWEAYLASLDSH